MSKYIIAKKLNMSQVFEEDGTVVPITWVELTQKEDSLEEGTLVDIKGVSKGKGFAGVVKRHGFAGGPATHGQSDRHRAPGSIGAATSPSKVLKGRKMAGRYGGKNLTIKDKKIIKVEEARLAISGPLPGSYGSSLKLLIQVQE